MRGAGHDKQRKRGNREPHDRQAEGPSAGEATRMAGNALAHENTTPDPASRTLNAFMTGSIAPPYLRVY